MRPIEAFRAGFYATFGIVVALISISLALLAVVLVAAAIGNGIFRANAPLPSFEPKVETACPPGTTYAGDSVQSRSVPYVSIWTGTKYVDCLKK